MPELYIRSVLGEEMLPFLEGLAELRIAVFREWPYLYEGSAEYERTYLQRYVDCPESIAVLAFSGDELVGASTGLPLAAADEDFRVPFAATDYPIDSVFYCAESVLLPAWRGRGMGRRFFAEREAQAKKCGAIWSVFCSVDRSKDDPRHPSGYRDLGSFWSRLGYERKESVKASFSWREVGAEEESLHPMTFWVKRL